MGRQIYRAYLYWTPSTEWATSAEFEFEILDSHSRAVFTDVPAQVETTSLPLTITYFSPFGIFAGASGTYVHQSVRYTGSSLPDGSNNFVVVDAIAGFRLPGRRGIIALEVNNLFNSGFKFQDYSFRSFGEETSTPVSPYVPERRVFARAAFNF